MNFRLVYLKWFRQDFHCGYTLERLCSGSILKGIKYGLKSSTRALRNNVVNSRR